jgi:hypothetical protein
MDTVSGFDVGEAGWGVAAASGDTVGLRVGLVGMRT